MAKAAAAWGIDIGQCALKALRCHIDEKSPGKVVADAFDYIEYPKILSQPDADPVELVRQALNTFLERNDLRGCKVAVSVSGQSGLARFIKLPPVETKKIPDIVRYEANQQIPFDLDEVIWDYQRMFGGSEEDGFALETEVGLFAMKREQVYQEIEPYLEAAVDVDIVQLAPLAIYNCIVFDQLEELPPEDEFDPDDPPESVVALSIGTEATDLVITNSYRVWQRSVPLGGSHFTKALVKELQKTYGGAEELKRRATEAEDPKALYQAMRPVFKDLLTEIQRSIGYFHSLDKAAKIGRVIALGNSMKLPGLKRYLAQNLGEEVVEVTKFKKLTGSAVVASPGFKDNVLSFAVPYGLTLQALGVGRLTTNLVPVELVRDRNIDRKKPWAVAASVLLALGCLINFMILWWPWSRVRIDTDSEWKSATSQVQQVQTDVTTFGTAHQTANQTYQQNITVGDQLLAHYDRRADWLNMCQAVYQSLPTDAPVDELGASPDDKADANDVTKREKVWLTELRSRRVEDLGTWYTEGMAEKYLKYMSSIQIKPPPGQEDQPKIDPAATLFGGGADEGAAAKKKNVIEPLKPQFPSGAKPSGPGFIIELVGYHLHSSTKHASSDHFVRRTLVHNLQNIMVSLPDEKGGQVEVPVRDLGITHPLVFEMRETQEVVSPESSGSKARKLNKYNFVVQFAWQPKPLKADPARFAAKSPNP